MALFPQKLKGLAYGLIYLVAIEGFSFIVLAGAKNRLGWHLDDTRILYILLLQFILSCLFGISIAKNKTIFKRIMTSLVIIWSASLLVVFVYTSVRVFVLHDYY